MFENPRRGRQARNYTKNVPKILDLKSSSEHIFPKIDVAHFFVHFLATNLHEYNVKRSENVLVLGNLGGTCMFLFTFSTAAHFFKLRYKIGICSVILGQFGSFFKITRASILFSRLIDLEAIVPSLP